jgi:hypothetical protein
MQSCPNKYRESEILTAVVMIVLYCGIQRCIVRLNLTNFSKKNVAYIFRVQEYAKEGSSRKQVASKAICLLLDPEDWGDMFLPNVRWLLTGCTPLYSTTQKYPYSPLWKTRSGITFKIHSRGYEQFYEYVLGCDSVLQLKSADISEEEAELCLLCGSCCFLAGLTLRPRDGGHIFLRKEGCFSPDYVALYFRSYCHLLVTIHGVWIDNWIYWTLITSNRGSVVGWGTMLEGRGFDFRWDHWIFQLT